jgi:predicted nucleotidyltransferase component of viral defense system
VIARGHITRRANEEGVPAQTIERDYILAHICAEIGNQREARLIFKGGTFLRLCCFEGYRYSADLDFSAIDGLSQAQALNLVATTVISCQQRLEIPALSVGEDDGSTSWLSYVGPLHAKPRRLKLDISDNELVESHRRFELQPLWSDLPDGAAIEGYTMEEIGAEKLRCIAERVQCRDLFDLHELLEAQLDPLAIWALYLRKAENDRQNGKQRTSPHVWASRFERRLMSYRSQWSRELSEYMSEPPRFEQVERRTRRHLTEVLQQATALQ